MAVNAAASCMHWGQSISPLPSSSSQIQDSAISSSSSMKRSRSEGAIVCRFVLGLDRPALFGAPSAARSLRRSGSCEYLKSGTHSLRRACSAGLDSSFDDEKNQRLVPSDDKVTSGDAVSDSGADSGEKTVGDCHDEGFGSHRSTGIMGSRGPFLPGINSEEPSWLEIQRRAADWPGGGGIIPEDVAMKAKSVDLPLSLLMIRRKRQWEQGMRNAGECSFCSVKKAFSSLVFIIRELHCYTLRMLEAITCQDLQKILVRVKRDLQASFVWLFQQVFASTPTLMVYIMILLANFTVQSMAINVAVAASPLPAAATETATGIAAEEQGTLGFDSPAVKNLASGGKAASMGGNGGGGGKVRRIAGGTDGDDGPKHDSWLPLDGPSLESVVSGQLNAEEEKLWDSLVEEASRMRTTVTGEKLELLPMVSPVTAICEPDGGGDYWMTEVLYQSAVAQEPENPLVLANFAEFLSIVLHDHDRAEEYFRRAVGAEVADAAAWGKYAVFLWRVKKDHWGAEEAYQEAMAADPDNPFYPADYANFLWSTGGEDTCFPL